jgi:hypothetical protein
MKDSAESTDRPNQTPTGTQGGKGGIPFLIAGDGITLRKLPNGSYEVSISAAMANRLLKTAGGNSYGAENSIQLVGSKFSFVNDTAAPGASKYYGTDAAAALGYHALSALAAPTADGQILVSSGGAWVPTTPVSVPVVVGITYNTGTHKLTYEYGSVGVVSWSPSVTVAEVFEAEECAD